jgi:hypothetical protein
VTIKRSDLENLQQLALELDLPAPEEEAGLDPEQVRRVSMAAMQALETKIGSVSPEDDPLNDMSWFGDYLRLKDMGWEWRLAAYIAWEASPKKTRWPGSVTELATQVLGLMSPRVIYTWRKKNPTIDEVVSVMQTAPLFAHRRDVIEALIAVAADPDYKGHADRKLFCEMLGDYTPRQQVVVSDNRAGSDELTTMSDEELRKRAEVLREADGGEDEIASSHPAGDDPTPATPSGASSHKRGAPFRNDKEKEGASDSDLTPTSSESEEHPRA